MSLSKKFFFIPLLAILILGFFLRSNNLNTWPRLGATFDEYAWTWLGMNLIQEGIPKSWSPHPQYENRKHLVYQGAAFFIVEPYLEHPPVFGLLAGSFALLRGANNMLDVTLPTIRPLALILGLISILLVYFFTKEIYGRNEAIISSILFASIPTVVIGSRIVQNENFFIPIWLLSILLIAKYLKNERVLFRNLAAILCGLLILAKIPWAAAGLSIILILLAVKKYNDAFKFCLLLIPIGFIYFLYGFYFDKDLFLSLWGLQLNRYDLTFNSIFALFQKPYLVDRFYTDGWIYFGWISLFLLFIKDVRKNLFIIIPVLSYFLVFLSAIPDEAGHGWYRYPFYPFLIISIALFIKEYFAKNWQLTFISLVFIGTSLFQLTWANVFGFSYIIFRASILGWMISLVPIFSKNTRLINIARWSSYVWLVVFILLNVWAVLLYNEQ